MQYGITIQALSGFHEQDESQDLPSSSVAGSSNTQLYAMNCRIGGSATTKKSGESRDPIRRGGEGKVAMTCRIIVHFINMFGKGREGERKEMEGREVWMVETSVAELGLA